MSVMSPSPSNVSRLLVRFGVLQADVMVLLVVLLSIEGQWVVGPAVEEPGDHSDDEHLTDHHLLAQHWTQGNKYNKPTTNQQMIKLIN